MLPRTQHPRRRPPLGQHFLTDTTASARIVAALGPIDKAAVVEIGPGKGALTRLLASKSYLLAAYELDPVLAARLKSEFASLPNVEVVQADFLSVRLDALAERRALDRPGQKLLIVGNLPYARTSEILLHLFEQAGLIQRAVVMVQQEVAERLAATPGVRDYGLLSATAGMHADIEFLFSLAPGSFSPPPKVRSAVVRLTMQNRFQKFQVEREPFLRFLRQIFAQKRKTLANNLAAAGFDRSAVGAAIRACGFEPTIRAEAVAIEEAARLYRILHG